MSSLWLLNGRPEAFSWRSYDVVACLLAILGFAATAPAAAAVHAPCGLAIMAGLLVLAAGRQLLSAQLASHLRGSDVRLSSAQWVLLAKSLLSSSLIALVSVWACALGLLHLPSAALIVVALCAIDINAHTFDPAFTVTMMACTNLFHFWLLAARGECAPAAAEGGGSVPRVAELVVLPLMMVLLQAQVGQ